MHSFQALLCYYISCKTLSDCCSSVFPEHCIGWLVAAGEHIENTLEALRALIKKDNQTPGGLKTLAYIEFDVHVSLS